MDQKVLFPSEKTPTWTQLVGLLASRDLPLQMRMIDGELAYPDETPPQSWRELRVGTPHGMITLRREPDGVALITWGNADDKIRQAWNGLAWALAYLSGGPIQTPAGSMALEDFAKTAELPGGFLA